MSSSEVVKRMKRTAAGAQPQPPATPAETGSTEVQPKGPRPLRYALILDRDLHRSLRLFAINHGVDASAVMRTLLRRMLEDPELERAVLARIAEDKRQ